MLKRKVLAQPPDFQQCRQEIEVRHLGCCIGAQRAHLLGAERTTPLRNHQGDVNLFVEEILTVVNGGMFAERFSVIASVDYNPGSR